MKILLLELGTDSNVIYYHFYNLICNNEKMKHIIEKKFN